MGSAHSATGAKRRAGRVVVSALTFVAATVGTAAAAAPAHADNPTRYEWRITGVGPAHPDQGAWMDCVDFSADPTPHSVNCALSTSVTASVTGSINVTVDDLSASVGYSVGVTSGVTGGESYNVDANKSGSVEWAPGFTANDVTQTEYLCQVQGGACTPTGNTAVAVTRKYQAPTFRLVYS